ncbi:hypothetical protein PWG15_10435 [Ensifer adhaerens]|uniref:hypothetical protein n=1 Tax=Ensifer adhaerens TaxID=106592 RepID=UPI0023A9E813|nr:hypothetical protein [Ensifer adhaerens]WDZ75046.1 hypothetical protein PWG15_10435 [Ensifer adhaerens]
MWPFENDEYPEGYVLSEAPGQPKYRWSDYGQRHGAAVLHHRFGRPYAADNVRLPDGSRGRAHAAHIDRQDWRRPLNDHERAWSSAATAIPIRWRWGTLVVTPDDLVFEDDQSPPSFELAGHNAQLNDDLCQSVEIKQLALTMEGCNALYGSLLLGLWGRSRDAEEGTSYSRKEAAKLLAKVRGLGETHYDIKGARWLNYRAYPSELQSVSHYFERLGWYDLTEKPAGNTAADERPYEPDGLRELMRRLTLFLVASMVALFILLAAMAVTTK